MMPRNEYKGVLSNGTVVSTWADTEYEASDWFRERYGEHPVNVVKVIRKIEAKEVLDKEEEES